MNEQEEKNINRQTIDNFNPDTMSFEQSCQDFLLKLLEFDAGTGYENFNDFIKEEFWRWCYICSMECIL